jgi:hypothetical protein
MVPLLAAEPAVAQTEWVASVFSRHEVPAVSTFARGTFKATLSADLTRLDYELTFSKTDGTVLQSHIHIAQAGVNGGIMTFLCSNLGNGPAGTQACPASGTITGTIEAANIVASALSQGVPAGSFFEFQRALRQGVAYVNVHSSLFPGGELRGQIEPASAKRGASSDGQVE